MNAFGNFWRWMSGDTTKDAVAQLQKDVVALQQNIHFLASMLLFEGSSEPLIDINEIFSSVKKEDSATTDRIKKYCAFYIQSAKKRAEDALIFVEAFESREKKIDPVLKIYADLQKREGLR